MTLLYRCNQCNQETTIPVTLSVQSGQTTPQDIHACGPDDAIRLIAPLIRDEGTLSIMVYLKPPVTQRDPDWE